MALAKACAAFFTDADSKDTKFERGAIEQEVDPEHGDQVGCCSGLVSSGRC